MFASNGALFSSLLPWYPLITDRLDLDPVEFGFTVAAFAVGAIVSSALPPALIRWFGPLQVAVGSTVLLAAAIAAAAWSPAGWAFAAAIFVMGFADAVTDVAQNVAGIRVQNTVGRPILSSMHALWSLGGVIAAAASTGAAAAGIDMRLYLAIASIAGVVTVSVGANMVGASAHAPEPPAGTRQGSNRPAERWSAVLRTALPLVFLAICGTVVEEISNSWTALAGVEIGTLPPQVAGVAFTVALGSQCIGRFTGDPLIHRFGAVAIARGGGALILMGGIVIVVASGPIPLLFGLALMGYGSATLVPSAMSAAATIRGFSQSSGVTIVSWLMRIGFLITSPLIGTLTELGGLRWGLTILLAVGAGAILLAGALPPLRPNAE